jgi:hypothetical protein
MFKWDELEELKKHSLLQSDDIERKIEERLLEAILITVYQNEQILRELKSIGWKMKEAMDKNV